MDPAGILDREDLKVGRYPRHDGGCRWLFLGCQRLPRRSPSSEYLEGFSSRRQRLWVDPRHRRPAQTENRELFGPERKQDRWHDPASWFPLHQACHLGCLIKRRLAGWLLDKMCCRWWQDLQEKATFPGKKLPSSSRAPGTNVAANPSVRPHSRPGESVIRPGAARCYRP